MSANRDTRYCESINILYSNIVHIREDLRVLPLLESALPSQRFLSIRRLEVLCEFSDWDQDWRPFCESLSHLSNLEYCQIWLVGNRRPGLLTLSESCQALEPLLTMPGMREFRVFLATEDITDVAEKFRGAPFRLGLCEPVAIFPVVSCGIGEQCTCWQAYTIWNGILSNSSHIFSSPYSRLVYPGTPYSK